MVMITVFIIFLFIATAVMIILYKFMDIIGATLLAIPLGFIAFLLAFITGGAIFFTLLGTAVVVVSPNNFVSKKLERVEFYFDGLDAKMKKDRYDRKGREF